MHCKLHDAVRASLPLPIVTLSNSNRAVSVREFSTYNSPATCGKKKEGGMLSRSKQAEFP